MANEDEMIKTLEQNIIARCISLFSYAFTLMTARMSNLEENYVECILLRHNYVRSKRVEQVRLTGMNNSFRKTGESGFQVSTCKSLFCQ